MPDTARERYGIDALRQRAPRDQGLLIVGLGATPEDIGGWRRTTREVLPEAADRPLVRTIWDDPSDREKRILIDVVQCPSNGAAYDALADRLEYNQLATVPRGPDSLGEASFVHPEGVPPAVYFVRGNLLVMVASFGRLSTPVLQVATRLDARAQRRPTNAREGLPVRSTDTAAQAVKAGTAIVYELRTPLGDDGYVAIFVQGSTAELRDGRIILTGAAVGPVRVDVYAVDPGRETLTGHWER
jgi:hypothetical protein